MLPKYRSIPGTPNPTFESLQVPRLESAILRILCDTYSFWPTRPRANQATGVYYITPIPGCDEGIVVLGIPMPGHMMQGLCDGVHTMPQPEYRAIWYAQNAGPEYTAARRRLLQHSNKLEYRATHT